MDRTRPPRASIRRQALAVAATLVAAAAIALAGKARTVGAEVLAIPVGELRAHAAAAQELSAQAAGLPPRFVRAQGRQLLDAADRAAAQMETLNLDARTQALREEARAPTASLVATLAGMAQDGQGTAAAGRLAAQLDRVEQALRR